MKRMNKVVALTVTMALLLPSMDMVMVKANENITESVDVAEVQTLQEFAEGEELQNVTAGTPSGNNGEEKNQKDFVIEKEVLIKYNGKEKNVVIPKGVKEIGDVAFFGCINLKSVEFPEGVTKIGSRAFGECSNLKKVRLPKTLKKIGDSVFYKCEGLESIEIPEGVTRMGSSSFYGCSDLKEVSLPKTLKTIGDSTFFKCKSLKSIELPERMTKLENYMFYGCRNLKEVSLPKALRKIGSYTFYGCKSLEKIKIPGNVTKIDERAFYGCKKLKSVKLSEKLKAISPFLFAECNNLENIVIPESVTNVQEYAFLRCKKIEKIKLSKNLKIIGNGAFSECVRLKNIVIPKSVKKIQQEAFKGCINLENITLPNSVEIEARVFQDTKWQKKKKGLIIVNHRVLEAKGCKGTVNIPEGVTEIGDGAFLANKDITSVVFPKSLKKIGHGAFYGCSKLKNIKSAGNISFIDVDAFRGTKWFKHQQTKNSMVILDGILIDGRKCSGDIVIPKGVTCISTGAFYYCKNLTSVKFPAGLKTIENSAFKWCQSLSLENIKLPDGLKSIGEEAFMYTDGKYIKIPKSVSSIGELAFGMYDAYGEGDFETDSTFVVCGYSKTAAQSYAKKNKMKFVDIGKMTFKKEEIQKVYGDKPFTVKLVENSKNTIYASSDKKVATVSKAGKVTLKGVGETYITIQTPANGKKKGTCKKLLLSIYPQKTKILSVVSKEGEKIEVTWEKSQSAEGYCIEYSTDRNFKKSEQWFVEGIGCTSEEIYGNSGQTYYIRVCACGRLRYLFDDMWDEGLLGEYSEIMEVVVK